MTRLTTKHPVLSFCVLTFAIAWGYNGLHLMKQSGGVTILHPQIVKQFSPAIAGLILIALTGGGAGLKSVIKSIVNWRIGWSWLLLSLFAEPLLFSGIIFAYWLAHGQLSLANAYDLLTTLAAASGTFFIGLLRWGFSEEVGWRGWLLPKLQHTHSPFAAALLMSVIVTLWHLNPSELSALTTVRESPYLYGAYPEVLERLIITFPITLLMNFIFNRSGGSLLAMMIFHSASNTSYFALRGRFPELTSDFGRLGFLIGLIILGVTLAIAYLTRKPASSSTPLSKEQPTS